MAFSRGYGETAFARELPRNEAGLPSRSSQLAEYEGESPPPPLRGYGETAFALDHERRLVAQIFTSWNRTTDWLKALDEFRIAA
jgi:hypothetical protein